MESNFDKAVNKIIKGANVSYNKSMLYESLKEIVEYMPAVATLHRSMYKELLLQGYTELQAASIATDYVCRISGLK